MNTIVGDSSSMPKLAKEYTPFLVNSSHNWFPCFHLFSCPNAWCIWVSLTRKKDATNELIKFLGTKAFCGWPVLKNMLVYVSSFLPMCLVSEIPRNHTLRLFTWEKYRKKWKEWKIRLPLCSFWHPWGFSNQKSTLCCSLRIIESSMRLSHEVVRSCSC